MIETDKQARKRLSREVLLLGAEVDRLEREVREWKRRASITRICTVCGNVCV